eukprot:11790532-Alexandrium_andersonii.AAC.1
MSLRRSCPSRGGLQAVHQVLFVDMQARIPTPGKHGQELRLVAFYKHMGVNTGVKAGLRQEIKARA